MFLGKGKYETSIYAFNVYIDFCSTSAKAVKTLSWF